MQCAGEARDGSALFVLHHGLGADGAFAFGPLQRVLASRGVRSCAIDRPGYGFSPAPETKDALDQFAQTAHEALIELGEDVTRAHVLGVGAGAVHALRMAKYSKRVFLINPVVSAPKGFDDALRAMDAVGYFAALGLMRWATMAGANPALARMAGHLDGPSLAVAKELVSRARSYDTAEMEFIFKLKRGAEMGKVRDKDLSVAFSDIDDWGVLDSLKQEFLVSMSMSMLSKPTTTLPNTGYLAHLQNPDAVAKFLLD